MKFKRIVNEIKGDLVVGDEITLPQSHVVWTIEDEDDRYFTIKNNDNGEKTSLSKFNLASVKKVPILEYKTQEEKTAEIARYKKQQAELKTRMAGFKANSKQGEEYKRLQRRFEQLGAALDMAQRSTPYINLY